MKLFAAAVAIGLVACAGNETTPFEPGVAPLEANPVAAPAANVERLNVEAGHDATSYYTFARGWVHAPIRDTWRALADPNVVVDHAGIDSFTVEPNVESGYDVSFRTHYVIEDVVTVEFELTWRQSDVTPGHDGSRVVAVYSKTWGSTFVDMMKGSIELTEQSPETTGISFVQRLDAMATDESNIESWTRELYANVLAKVRGEPVPAQ